MRARKALEQIMMVVGSSNNESFYEYKWIKVVWAWVFQQFYDTVLERKPRKSCHCSQLCLHKECHAGLLLCRFVNQKLRIRLNFLSAANTFVVVGASPESHIKRTQPDIQYCLPLYHVWKSLKMHKRVCGLVVWEQKRCSQATVTTNSSNTNNCQ